MGKTKRFGLVLTPTEKAAMERLADVDGLPQAAIVRSLIRQAAKERGLWLPQTTDRYQAPAREVRDA